MDEDVLNNFLRNFPHSNSLVFESREALQNYVELLRNSFITFIEKIRIQCYDYQSRGDRPDYYLIGIRGKIENHKNYLFEKRGKGFNSVYNNILNALPIQNGRLLFKARLYQKKYLQKAIDYLNSQIQVSLPASPREMKPLKKSVIESHSVSNGFKIFNERNLSRAWELLTSDNHKFISDTVTYNNFERNFTGKTIRKRITWIESENCLHYFIDGISGNHSDQGSGIEKEDAIWIKAAQVFEKENGSPFNSENLSHATRKPNGKQIENLNRIIAIINRQSSQRLS